MKPRAAALALAAPLLFTAPALADHGKVSKRAGATISVQTDNGGLYFNVGNRGYGSIGYSTNRYGNRDYGYQHRGDYRQMKRQAARACRAAIRSEAHYRGFRDVDFDRGRYVEQIGPRGFVVTFNEVEFETRRRDIERSVTCVVRRGDIVKRIDGIPTPRRGHHNRRGYYK